MIADDSLDSAEVRGWPADSYATDGHCFVASRMALEAGNPASPRSKRVEIS